MYTCTLLYKINQVYTFESRKIFPSSLWPVAVPEKTSRSVFDDCIRAGLGTPPEGRLGGYQSRRRTKKSWKGDSMVKSQVITSNFPGCPHCGLPTYPKSAQSYSGDVWRQTRWAHHYVFSSKRNMRIHLIGTGMEAKQAMMPTKFRLIDY